MVTLLLWLAPAYVLFVLYMLDLAGFGLGEQAWRLALGIGGGVWLLLAGFWVLSRKSHRIRPLSVASALRFDRDPRRIP